MPYYHSCPLILQPGSIIMPGNWGRMVNSEPVNNQHGAGVYLITESIFEMVRVREFPTKVSRLQAAFVFETEGPALDFTRSKRNLPYEVELVEPAAPSSRHDFNGPTFPLPGQAVMPTLEIKARQYWTGETMTIPEVLTMSPLRIVRRLI